MPLTIGDQVSFKIEDLNGTTIKETRWRVSGTT
jgi:hypothetical protein